MNSTADAPSLLQTIAALRSSSRSQWKELRISTRVSVLRRTRDWAMDLALLDSTSGVTNLRGELAGCGVGSTLTNPDFLAFADRTRAWRRLTC